MTWLPCDECFALDYLAILWVKRENGLKVDQEIDRVTKALEIQLRNLDQAMASSEWKRLIDSNRITFEMIELANKGQVSAEEVQKKNRDRYLAKKAMQSRFWPDSELSEQKTPIP